MEVLDLITLEEDNTSSCKHPRVTSLCTIARILSHDPFKRKKSYEPLPANCKIEEAIPKQLV